MLSYYELSVQSLPSRMGHILRNQGKDCKDRLKKQLACKLVVHTFGDVPGLLLERIEHSKYYNPSCKLRRDLAGS